MRTVIRIGDFLAGSFVRAAVVTYNPVNYSAPATAFTGTKALTVLLKKGTYRFYCSIHPTIMTHTFKVG